MSDWIITALLLIVAVIHLLPITGLLGAPQLASLYGVEISDRNLQILMRHRAALFAILGAFLAYAAFVPEVQPIGFVAAFFSIASFFFLTRTVGGYNDALRRVVIADVVAAVALAGAVAVYLASN